MEENHIQMRDKQWPCDTRLLLLVYAADNPSMLSCMMRRAGAGPMAWKPRSA